MLKLIIGNRAYSSWSMRGWLAVKQSGEEFEELVVPMFDEEWEKRREGDEFAPSLGKVPILWDGDCVVWDSLAIIEFLADRVGRERYWPEDAAARAVARSMSAEMHSSFSAAAPRTADERAQELSVQATLADDVRAEIDRVLQLWAQARARFGGTGDYPVRRLVRGRHDVRAGRHPLPHLWRPRAQFRRRLHEGGAVTSATSPNGSTRPRTNPG